MVKLIRKSFAVLAAAVVITAFGMTAYAAGSGADAQQAEAAEVQEETDTEDTGDSAGVKAIAAGICVGVAAFGGALGMAFTTAKSNEAIARQPEASGEIRSSMMLGIVFIETAIIYALIAAILVIFVL